MVGDGLGDKVRTNSRTVSRRKLPGDVLESMRVQVEAEDHPSCRMLRRRTWLRRLVFPTPDAPMTTSLMVRIPVGQEASHQQRL